MKKAVALAFAVLCLCAMVTAGPAEEQSGEDRFVDLDLSILSGTVVYAQIYNMLYDPSPFLGKVIRVSGYYDAFRDEKTETVYHACVVQDATACCAQGIEFVWKGEHTYPDDYAAPGTKLTVTGRLEMYQEGDASYLHLVDADVVWDTTGEEGK